MSTTPVTAERRGDVISRVIEADGTLAGGERSPSDGGGFRDHRDAEHLAASINARRAAKGGLDVPEAGEVAEDAAMAPESPAPKPKVRKRSAR